MRIAVLADTHDRLPASLPNALAHADEIWHLGDVTQPSLLEQVRTIGPPVKVVRGNCDSEVGWPLECNISLAGLSIRLIHIPPRKLTPGIDLLLHGHTHVPRDEMVGSTRFLNPGCITRPSRGAPASYAWLTLHKGEPVEWDLHLLK